MILYSLTKVLPKDLRKKFYILASFTLFIGILETLSLSLLLPIINSIFDTGEKFPIDIDIIKNFFSNVDFNELILIFLIIFLIKNFFLGVFNWYLQKILAKIRSNLSLKFYNNYFGQEYEKFKNFNSSQIIRNIVLEVNSFASIFQNLLNLISEILIIFLILFFLFYYDFKLTLLASIIIVTIGIIYYIIFKNYLKNLGKESVTYSKNVIKNIQESFSNFKIIKILNQLNYFSEDFINKNLKSINALRMLAFIQSLTRIWLETILIIIFIIMIFFFKTDEQFNQSSLAKLSFFIIASLKIVPSMNKVINFMQKLKYSNATINIILNEIKKLSAPENQHVNNNIIFDFKKDLFIKNISFNYEKKEIIKNVSFTIKNSEIILVTGPSGVGKSTLVEIICGLMNPKKGEIFLGDKNIFHNIIGWQNNLAYVPQSTSLIQDTITNNIAFSTKMKKIKNSDIQIKKIIKLVEMEKFIENLDEKEQTIIDENFINISGGQAQRLGIARALYQNPKIIIFDESFNSLDKKVAHQILLNIREAYNNIKIIIISHDLHFKNLANQIIELK